MCFSVAAGRLGKKAAVAVLVVVAGEAVAGVGAAAVAAAGVVVEEGSQGVAVGVAGVVRAVARVVEASGVGTEQPCARICVLQAA